MSGDKLRVDEIFGPTIQGEGPLAGSTTYFVRLGGCDFRCSWCDTMHAVDPKYRANWEPMTSEDILAKLQELVPYHGVGHWVTISGGNPANQDCGRLIGLLVANGFKVAMETQGSQPRPWFEILDMLVVSPKPPSSGMENEAAKVAECFKSSDYRRSAAKYVIADQTDLDWALWFHREVRSMDWRVPALIYLQPMTADLDSGPGALLGSYRWLCETVAKLSVEARVIPQLHALAWGNMRGV